MAVLALAVYLIGLVTCFGVRTWSHYRRTGGDTGFRSPGRDASAAARGGALLFVGALVLGLAGPLLETIRVVSALVPVQRFPAIQWLGVLLAVLGIVGTVLSQHAMGASWRIGVEATEKTALVDHGVFGWSRNPIFSAMTLTTGGLTLVVPNAVQLAGLISLIAAIEVQTRWIEEPYLMRTHRHDYLAYASRVGRFVPGIGRLSLPYVSSPTEQ